MEVPALNKFEKEKRVVDLHKEGKTMKQIAMEVHMSFRDINWVIKKYERSLKSKIKRRDNQVKPINKISKSSKTINYC